MAGESEKFSHILEHYFRGEVLDICRDMSIIVKLDLGFEKSIVKKFSLLGVQVDDIHREQVIALMRKCFFDSKGNSLPILLRSRKSHMEGEYLADVFTRDDEHVNTMIIALKRYLVRTA